MRPIDADALMENLGIKEECKDCQFVSGSAFCGKSADFVDACAAICEAPTIEPKHGHWIYPTDETMPPFCSRCKAEAIDYTESDYCPNCGAKMEAEQDEKSV